MKQIPRLFTALCVATLASVTAFAAPNPKWVPAQSDFVITIDGLDVADPAADQVWKDAYTKIGMPQQSPLETIKLLEEECPGITEVFKVAFGLNDDFTVTDTKSITFACTLQKEAGEDDLDDTSAVLVIENPKANLDTLEATLRKALEAKLGDDAHFVREGKWLALREKIEAGKPEKGVLAICQIPEGYLVALQRTMKAVETIGSDSFKAIPADHPLMKAFTQRPDGTRLATTYLLEDLSELATRLSTPETLQIIKAQHPAVLKSNAVTVTSITRGTTTDIALTIATDEPTAAQQLMEVVLGYKMMAQMMGPAILGKPDSKIVAFISKIACTVEGNNLVVKAQITPETFIPVLEEIAAIQAQQQQMAEAIDLDDEEEDEAEEDLSDVPAMTKEEAAAILDALDNEEAPATPAVGVPATK